MLRLAGGRGVELVTLPAGLGEPVTGRELEASSWGRDKDLRTWDSPGVAEFAFAARRAELKTLAAAAGATADSPALARAARDLMALQASDWAFITTYELAADYPRQRVDGHLADLHTALAALADSRRVPEPELRNLAPELDLSPLVAP